VYDIELDEKAVQEAPDAGILTLKAIDRGLGKGLKAILPESR